MTMPSMCKMVVCFDLDDTLYKEIDFLKSGYHKVAELVAKRYGIDEREVYDNLLSWYYSKENAFALLNETYGLDNPIEEYLNIYRYHQPDIVLSDGVAETLNALKTQDVGLGIITDGRTISQQNKIEALGLGRWFEKDYIFINEEPEHFKPNHWSFDRLMLCCREQYGDADISFYYVGDNPKKDFIAPNQLGWQTICLMDDGRNIHSQDFSGEQDCLPQNRINKIRDILSLVFSCDEHQHIE